MIGWAGAASVALALALLSQWRLLPTADVSWQLYAADRVLDGARIGRDLIDVNFPLIILDKLPAVLAARLLGLDAWHAWVLALVLLLAISLALSAGVPDSWFAKPVHAVFAALVLLAAPRGDFGQREHVAVLATLPYLVVAGARLDGRDVRGGLALACGLLAVPGLALKPFFLVVPVAIWLVQWRRGLGPGRLAALPEHRAVAIGVPLLWLGQLAVAPDWLASARWYWPLYSRYGGGIWIQLGVVVSGIASLVIAGLLLARWRARGHLDAEAEALATGMLGFFACVVLQGRSLTYHFVPVVALAALLAVRWLTARHSRSVVPVAGVALLVLLIVTRSAWDGAQVIAGRALQRQQEDPYLPGLQRALGTGGRVAVLSTNPASIFPLVPSLGAQSPFRQISLWPLIGLYAPAVYGDTVVTCAEAPAWGVTERHWRDEIAADLGRGADAIVVLEPDLATRGWGDARRLDYLACLRRDARLRPLLDAFTPTARVGPYRVLRRTTGTSG